MKCEKCSAEMNCIIHKSEEVWTCPKCGWGFAVTHIEPIYNDLKKYTISLKKNQNIDKTQLKLISKIANCNYIAAKNKLTIGENKLIEDKAYLIKQIAKELNECNISFDITPEFPYEYK